MDENTDNTTTEQQPVARERIGQRAWVRSAALVGGGLIAGASSPGR
jgi:hypothetical protein